MYASRKYDAQRIGGERLDRVARAENRPAERVILPETLREDLVDQIVGRVLHHLDFLDDDLLLPLHVVGIERRVEDDVGEDVEGERAGARRAP